jgi:hypothetical protein
MKRVKEILLAIVLIIANACDSEQVLLSDHFPLTCSIQSRSENTPLSLPIGSQILLNAQGGLDIENEIFTYNGSTWENGNDYHWTTPEEETDITALYPTYPNNDYSLTHLYSTGELADVLIAQKTYAGKENITLQFKHLFSSLTINLDETLLENIKDIQLTIPVKVNRIFPQEGTFSIIEETHIITQGNHGESHYSFIIPPAEACVLTLTLIMKDNTIHEHELNPHTFQSGVQYECNVLKAEQRPGIRNAEQLIAFSQLINGGSSDKWELSDFGEEIDGEMVYRLLADITLSEVECNLLEPIGKNTSFSNTFDGEGHAISNLKIKAQNGCGGLFSIVSSTGIIQNLNISNASGPIKVGAYSSGIGFIAGQCMGNIFNCHVSNSMLSNKESSYTGGIAGYTSGKIINSSVKNVTLESTTGSLGILTGYLYNGNITNSYSSNSTSTQSITHNGGICGYAKNGTIANCYIHSNINVKGQIVGTGEKSTITYCYCDQAPLYNENKNCTTPKNYIYKTDFTATSNNTPIHELLNQWIGNDTTYLRWKADTTLPAIFITQ